MLWIAVCQSFNRVLFDLIDLMRWVLKSAVCQQGIQSLTVIVDNEVTATLMDRLRSPSNVAIDNPAADRRLMRRIIANDPEWTLATVPDLVELTIRHIVSNFAS